MSEVPVATARPPRQQRPRATEPRRPVFVTMLAVFAAAAGFLTWRIAQGPDGTHTPASHLLSAAGMVVALIAIQNAQRYTPQMAGWILAGCGSSVWAGAWILRDVESPPGVLAYSVLIAISAALLIAGCLRLTGIGGDRRAWRGLAIELLPPMMALLAAIWLLEIGSFVRERDASATDAVGAGLQGLATVAQLVVGLLGALSWRRLRAHPALQSITVGLVVIAVGNGLWLRYWIAGNANLSLLAELAACIGFATIAIGGLQARLHLRPRASLPAADVLPPRLARKSLPLSLLVLLALAAGQAKWGELSADGIEIVTVAGLVVVIFAMFWENLVLERETVLSKEIGTLSQRIDGLISQVGRDALTGLLNRRALHERLERELDHTRTAGRSLAIALIDVDNFKQVNDTLGHQVGDQVLQAVASVLIGACRASDIAARYAGDEFVMIFPGTDEAVARQICERIAANVRRINEQLAPFSREAISLSIGVTVTRQGRRNVAQLIAIADAAMYDAKESGKDRVASVNADTLATAATWGIDGAVSAGLVGIERRVADDFQHAV